MRNITQTPKDPLCITGSVLTTTPFLETALFLSSFWLNKWRNRLVAQHNANLQTEIDSYFGNSERADDDIVTEEEMDYVGPALMTMGTESPILKQLSSEQALCLIMIDERRFRNLVAMDAFNDEAKVPVRKLLRLLELDTEGLANALAALDLQREILAEPASYMIYDSQTGPRHVAARRSA